MSILLLGLILFLGVHSVRLFGDGWRDRTIARVGEARWKGVYTVISIIGLVLIVWGYGQARQSPVEIWLPPPALRHLTSLFTLLAFILLAAAHGPGNHIRSSLRHPMTIGVLLWALGHLLANGMLADITLFGSFLLWALLVLRAARRRKRHRPRHRRWPEICRLSWAVRWWAVFAIWLHGPLIGVAVTP
ncbi:MAG: NnrU family protein [Burkholderiaceae bacterium]